MTDYEAFRRWVTSPLAGYCRENPDGSRYDWVADERAMREAEIAKQNNAVPAAGSDGSHSDGNRVRASDLPTGNTTMQFIHGDDITVRLTRWCEQPAGRVATQKLMDEAAREIERLRSGGACPHVRGTVTQHCSLNFTLTDAEREAVEEAGFYLLNGVGREATVATLRKMLARLA